MAVQIDASKFKINLDTGSVKPDAAFSESRLFGHLTKGWSGTDWTGDALSCLGSVPMKVGSVDSALLGFVQFARATQWQAFYAGRTAKEGSIILDYFIPPAMTATVFLDATKGSPDPFYRTPSNILESKTAQKDWGDHPGMSVPRTLENRAVSTVPNFLFHVIMVRDFVTILTGIANGGAPQYIAFFEWQVRYEFKVKWVSKQPQISRNASSFTLQTNPTAGAPTADHWKAMLAAPSGERANAVGGRAELQTVNMGAPNRQDLTTRFIGTVLGDFWA